MNKIVWFNGMLMNATHFQKQEQYYDTLITTMVKEQKDNMWGFFNCQINNSFLSSGNIILDNASGIMPDGTYFNLSATNSIVSFNSSESKPGDILELLLPISLNLKQEIADQLNNKNENLRYNRKELTVTDISSPHDEKHQLVIADLNFHISTSTTTEEDNGKFVSLKFAKIKSISTSGSIELDSEYFPTFIHANSSKEIMAYVSEILNILTFRGEELSERVYGTSHVASSEISDYLMYQVIRKYITRIKHLIKLEKLHMSDLFLELSCLGSELSVFSRGEYKDITYNHLDQNDSFSRIIDQLRQMLNLVLEQNSIALSLEKRKYGIHVSTITDRNLIKSCILVLAAKADLAQEKLTTTLPPKLKVGSLEKIRDLVNYQLPGFAIKSLSVAPREVSFYTGYSYFSILLDKEDKEQLYTSSGIALHISGEFPGLDLKLWAIRED